MIAAGKASARAPRLAIVVSHPIQHFTPFYRALAEESGVTSRVFFASRIGLERYHDAEMKADIAWSMNLTDGYDHEFLPGANRIKHVAPLAVNNDGVGAALDRFAPDSLLLYGYNLLTTLKALLWARRRGVPAIMTSDSELRSQRSGGKAALKAALIPLVLRQFRAFLTIGDNNEAYFRHYGVPASRLFRAPLTIDETVYRQARAERARLRSEFRAAHDLRLDDFVVLFVGKLVPRKRPADLLRAARRVDDSRLRLVFAGDGELREGLEAEARQSGVSARFLGFVNLDALPAVYAAADVLAHPSEADPHPLICSEGACVGLPLLLSDRVGALGATDIARPGVNALAFPCGDTGALGDALANLIDDPSTCATMSAASQRVYHELDMRRSLDGLLAALRFCAREGAKS